MRKTYTTLMIVSLVLISCAYAADERNEKSHVTQKVAQSSSGDAQITLEKYLLYRAKGRYEKCEEFLSKHFLDEFEKTFGTNYVNYYRHQDEEHYRGYKILSTKQSEKNLVVIHIMAEIEGPGYKYEALEQYYMIRKNEDWLINAWQFEDKDYRIKRGVSP